MRPRASGSHGACPRARSAAHRSTRCPSRDWRAGLRARVLEQCSKEAASAATASAKHWAKPDARLSDRYRQHGSSPLWSWFQVNFTDVSPSLTLIKCSRNTNQKGGAGGKKMSFLRSWRDPRFINCNHSLTDSALCLSFFKMSLSFSSNESFTSKRRGILSWS